MTKKILVIDDSALMRRVISDIINSDDRLIVEDTARDGVEGLEYILDNPDKYDCILLDINMPRLDGIGVLKKLNDISYKKPVIVCSALTRNGAAITDICLQMGAFDFITKPENVFEFRTADYKTWVIDMINAATSKGSHVSAIPTARKDIKQDKESQQQSKQLSEQPKQAATLQPRKKALFPGGKGKKVVALACSTGGPKSLNEVIPLLPADLDAPVLLVQHMPKGFTEPLAKRLNDMSNVVVKQAEDGEEIKKGHVYIAPGGSHLKVRKGRNGVNEVLIADDPPIVGLKPCANLMYESLVGMGYDEITCVVLTGMGADGTEGIGKLKEQENIYVIAQDKETSVVYGMPNMVAKAGLVDEIVPLSKVAAAITNNVGVTK